MELIELATSWRKKTLFATTTDGNICYTTASIVLIDYQLDGSHESLKKSATEYGLRPGVCPG